MPIVPIKTPEVAPEKMPAVGATPGRAAAARSEDLGKQMMALGNAVEQGAMKLYAQEVEDARQAEVNKAREAFSKFHNDLYSQEGAFNKVKGTAAAGLPAQIYDQYGKLVKQYTDQYEDPETVKRVQAHAIAQWGVIDHSVQQYSSKEVENARTAAAAATVQEQAQEAVHLYETTSPADDPGVLHAKLGAIRGSVAEGMRKVVGDRPVTPENMKILEDAQKDATTKVVVAALDELRGRKGADNKKLLAQLEWSEKHGYASTGSKEVESLRNKLQAGAVEEDAKAEAVRIFGGLRKKYGNDGMLLGPAAEREVERQRQQAEKDGTFRGREGFFFALGDAVAHMTAQRHVVGREIDDRQVAEVTHFITATKTTFADYAAWYNNPFINARYKAANTEGRQRLDALFHTLMEKKGGSVAPFREAFRGEVAEALAKGQIGPNDDPDAVVKALAAKRTVGDEYAQFLAGVEALRQEGTLRGSIASVTKSYIETRTQQVTQHVDRAVGAAAAMADVVGLRGTKKDAYVGAVRLRVETVLGGSKSGEILPETATARAMEEIGKSMGIEVRKSQVTSVITDFFGVGTAVKLDKAVKQATSGKYVVGYIYVNGVAKPVYGTTSTDAAVREALRRVRDARNRHMSVQGAGRQPFKATLNNLPGVDPGTYEITDVRVGPSNQ